MEHRETFGQEKHVPRGTNTNNKKGRPNWSSFFVPRGTLISFVALPKCL